jgi:tetratricopeptide (TPR) repeat protein
LLGALLGAFLARPAPSDPDASRLRRVAEQLERGRYQDLLGLGPALTSGASGDSVAIRALAAEASARLYADYGHRPSDRAAAEAVLGTLTGASPDAAQLARALTSTVAPLGGPPDTPKARVAHALRLADRGQLDAALEMLLGGLSLNPERRNTNLALARLQTRLGATEAASGLYQRLAARFPDDPGIQFELGVSALRRNQAPELPALDGFHPHEQARLALLSAVAAARKGEPAAAEAALREASSLDHPSRAFRGAVADVWLSLGRAFEARQIQTAMNAEQDPDREGQLRMARSRFVQRLSRCGVEIVDGRARMNDQTIALGRVGVDASTFAPFFFEPNDQLFPEVEYREVLRGETSVAAAARALRAANRVGLARVCLASNNPWRADQYLARAERMSRDLAEPELRARALLRQGRQREAQAVLQRVPNDQRTPLLGLMSARLLRNEGDLVGALDQLAPLVDDEDLVVPDLWLLDCSLRIELGQPPVYLERLGAARADGNLEVLLAVIEGSPARLDAVAETLAEGPISLDLPVLGLRWAAVVVLAEAPDLGVQLLEEAIARGDVRSLFELGRWWMERPTTRRAGKALLRQFVDRTDDPETRAQAEALLAG